YESVQNFISYVLSCLELNITKEIMDMLDEPFPGWNPKTKRLGKLFADKAIDFQIDLGKTIKLIY
ncbi:hypothetical protein CWN75_32485, partial [Klebsiella pneumoniae]